MRQLALAFVDIALHRAGPQRLPSANFLVVLLLVVYFPVNALRLYLLGSEDRFDYLFLTIDTLMFFSFVYAVLSFFRRTRRFRQTACALLGVDILINLIGLPVSAGNSAFENEGLATLTSVALLALFLWWIDVAGFIVSEAVEQPYLVGVMFVVFYVVAALSVLTAMGQAST